jgi:hypothetical protein
MNKNFIQAVQVNNNVTAIIALECVTAARKVMGNIIYDIQLDNTISQARKGDWIVQLRNGKWNVLKNLSI